MVWPAGQSRRYTPGRAGSNAAGVSRKQVKKITKSVLFHVSVGELRRQRAKVVWVSRSYEMCRFFVLIGREGPYNIALHCATTLHACDYKKTVNRFVPIAIVAAWGILSQ